MANIPFMEEMVSEVILTTQTLRENAQSLAGKALFAEM